MLVDLPCRSPGDHYHDYDNQDVKPEITTIMTMTVSVEYSSCGWARWARSICCCCICD